MKSLIKIVLLSALLSAVYGCASSGGNAPRLAPPEAMNPVFMRYQQLPGQKVFVVAIDPTGQWAFGYDHDRATLEEAAQNAAVKCDKAREKHQISSKGSLFAVNDEIVYYNQQ